MTFTVTYRGANGAPETEAVEATDRAACLAQLRARGIAPIGLKEGGAKKDERNQRKGSNLARRKSGAYILLIAIAFVLFAGGVWWWLGRDGAQPSQDDEPARKKPALAKEVKPAEAPKVPKQEEDASAAKPVETNTAVAKQEPPKELGKVVKAIPAGIVEKVVDEDGNVTYVKKKSPFTNRVDALVLSAIRPGGFPRGLRQWAMKHTKEELITALKSPVNFNEDDSEKLIADKQSLEEMKEQMVGLLEKGHTIDEVLGEIEPTVDAERTARAEADKTLRRLMREADAATVREYVKSANAELRAKGLKELYLPKKFREDTDQDGTTTEKGKAEK